MATYTVRVGYRYDFVRRMIENGRDQVILVKNALPEECSPELYRNRYTFGIYRVNADSLRDSKKLLIEAWHKAFPDENDEPTVYAVQEEESDQYELMRSIFSGYYGADEYLRLITEMYASIPYLKEAGALGALRMKSYIFAVDPGCGFTTLLSSFGDFLHRMHVYGEDDEERLNYTEFIVGKETENGRASVDDIISFISKKDEGPQNNVIGIDLGYYLEGSKFDELRSFSHRLYKYQNDFVFVFRVPFLEKNALDEVERVLSDVMLTQVVKIPPLHETVLIEQMLDELYRMGYSYDNALIDVFLEKIRREKKDGRFYGFKTVNKTVHGMILKKAVNDAAAAEEGEKPDLKSVRGEDFAGENGPEKAQQTGYDALADLVGMEKITERIREITAQVKMSMADDKLDRPCLHMRFTGAPGTGKTTVARIIGQIFREEGILRKGAFLEYSARSLCAEYVGQTAVRTSSICRDAYGSVLFIDEAYALYEGGQHNNDYGKEALTTLISEMENHRDDMLVIMAGYTDDMETLMHGNAGLRSRMPYLIDFPNYTRRQLFEIYMSMVKKHFSYDKELEEEAEKFFMTLPDRLMDSREFSNARYVRNLYERTWSKGSLRASLEGLDRVCLTGRDFIAASSEEEFSEMPERSVTVGFRS